MSVHGGAGPAPPCARQLRGRRLLDRAHVASDLERLYRERIIGGIGAFVVTADTDDSFAAAVKRKLVLEIGGTHAGPTLADVE